MTGLIGLIETIPSLSSLRSSCLAENCEVELRNQLNEWLVVLKRRLESESM